MSETDFVKLAAAYRRATDRMARQIVSIWQHGSTHAPVAVEFCAGDLVLATVEVIS